MDYTALEIERVWQFASSIKSSKKKKHTDINRKTMISTFLRLWMFD